MPMKRMLKNGIVIFAAICAIVLVVFCIELFVLNRESGDDDTGAGTSLSESAAAGDDADSDGHKGSQDIQPTNDTDQPGNAGGGQPTQQQPPPPPTGKRRELPMFGDMNLVLYADEGKFTYIELELSWIFEYMDNDAVTLEVCYVHMPMGVEARAGECLDGYVGAGGTSVGSEGLIGRSPLIGMFASGEKDGEKYEAWIYTFSEVGLDDMGVEFILHYRVDEQKNALYSILDSMSLVPA